MSKPILQVIIASVRPTRVGEKVADWFQPIAESNPAFQVERVDLREHNLPLMNEP
jgi:NAD(P)H-dependent FMN reductase